MLRPRARSYVTADFSAGADVKCDAMGMPFREGQVDILIASDVLEHIPDDRKALAEIRRVLSPGGTAILTVPQADHLATTFEDKTIVSWEEREVVYGQPDHVRSYGDDFPERLAQVGFTVSVVDHECFDSDFVREHVLFPPVLSTKTLGWNYRRVFFATKDLAHVSADPVIEPM